MSAHFAAGPSAALAEFVAGTGFESLPPEVVHQAKRCLLDFTGLAVGGQGAVSGTEDNPLSDAELTAKFLNLVEPLLGAERARALGDLVWRLEGVEDVRELVQAATR